MEIPDKLLEMNFIKMTPHSKREKTNLRWIRSCPGSFDLKLLNPEVLNKVRVGELLENLDKTGHRQRHLKKQAREELRQWLKDPSRPLSSQAYVLVSNWFLTSSGDRSSTLASVCRELWDELFTYRPEPPFRLSSPEQGQNHIILGDRFEEFYRQLIAAQDSESTDQIKESNSQVMENNDAREDHETYSNLAKNTHLEPRFYADLVELITKKKQLILEGPPGSGKTFVAEHFGRFLAYGDDSYAAWASSGSEPEQPTRDRFEVVQFHESYSYEDFVEGFRPKTVGGTMFFERESGIFKSFCVKAQEDRSEHQYVMMIDEINRGKPSKIFGELLYLLEYRNREIRLSSKAPFRIPENVLLIGTMNTADKSIALVDYALRRRFIFKRLRPLVGNEAPVLRSWLQQKRIQNTEDVLTLFVNLNRKIERNFGLDRQVGHSYFMDCGLSDGATFPESTLRQIWDSSILPLVQEYDYTQKPEKIEEDYSIQKIRDYKGL